MKLDAPGSATRGPTKIEQVRRVVVAPDVSYVLHRFHPSVKVTDGLEWK